MAVLEIRLLLETSPGVEPLAKAAKTIVILEKVEQIYLYDLLKVSQ